MAQVEQEKRVLGIGGRRVLRYARVRRVIQPLVRKTCLAPSLAKEPEAPIREVDVCTPDVHDLIDRTPVATIRETARRVVASCGSSSGSVRVECVVDVSRATEKAEQTIEFLR